MLRLAAVLNVHRPGGAAPGVAGRLVRRQHRAAQLHRVAIVQGARHLHSRIDILPTLVAILEVGLAAGFHHRHIGVHHFVFGAGLFHHLGAAGVMVEMGVADQQHLGIGPFEAQFGDTLFGQRHGADEARIDQDVALGRGDQIVRLALGADKPDIGDHMMRRKRHVIFGGGRGQGCQQRGKGKAQFHPRGPFFVWSRHEALRRLRRLRVRGRSVVFAAA